MGNFFRMLLIFFIASIQLSVAFADTTTTPATVTPGTAINEKFQMAENNPVGRSLCRGLILVKTYIVPVIILLWIITGIGFFIGKISWGIVIALAVGSTLAVSSSKIAAKVVYGDSDIKDACDCRYGVNCESAYE